jgi:hypothetical protein
LLALAIILAGCGENEMPEFKAMMFCVAIMLLATVAPAEAAKSAYDTGLAIGKKRGYPDPQCYATVFAANAVLGPDGKFKGPGRKAARFYKMELQSKCNISR